MPRSSLMRLVLVLTCVAVIPSALAGEADMATLETQFHDLPMAARRNTGPLFWMRGDESKERLQMYVGKVAEGGNGCFTTESRPHNDWLGPNWYRDLGICLDEAKKNNLKMWIFDEQWWPSQTVAGRVPPQYAAKKLEAVAADAVGPMEFNADGYSGECFIATIAGKVMADGKIDGASLLDLSQFIRNGKVGWTVPAGKWRIMKFTYKQVPGSVDGASKDCVDWFLKTVYQPHYDHFKEDFGKTIVRFFYDEPETKGDWGTELNRTLADWGVDWKKAYVANKFELAGEEQAGARFQYLDAFAETWGRTMYGGMAEWCHRYGVESVGHFMEHSNMYVLPDYCAGDMMRLQRYSDMGGIDAVFDQFVWGKREQRDAPSWSTPKLASSISHVFGKRDDLAMVEIFGARGQDLTYPEMKWWTDHMLVSGVNVMIPHSFNPRAPFDNDCPPYFYNGGYEPRWPLYRVYADYASRLSLMLSGGRHVCPVALLFNGNIRRVGKVLAPEPVTEALQDALSDCDWLPFDVFEKEAKLSGKEVQLQQERYQVLIVPGTEVIPYATLAKVKEFADGGGIVIGHGFLPTQSATIGKTVADIAKLNAGIPWKMLPAVPTVKDIKAAGIPLVMDVLEGETNGWLHVLHRVKDGRDVFFITNQNHLGDPRKFRFRIPADGVPECWDPMRNEITALPYRRVGGTVEMDITFQPSESVLLVFQATKRALSQRSVNMVATREIHVRDTRPAKPPSAKPPSAQLVVVKATYGVPGDAQRSRDMRERLQKMIDRGERQLQVGSLAQGDDPASGVVKTLVAECTAGDKRITLTGQDPQMIALNDRPSAAFQELNRIAAGRPFTTSPVEADPYTGVATIPADINLAASRIYLELDAIAPEEAAVVSINGKPAGGVICRPLRLDVTQFLKPGDNRIDVVPFSPKTAKLLVFAR